VNDIVHRTVEKDEKLATLRDHRDHVNACKSLERKLDLDLKREKVLPWLLLSQWSAAYMSLTCVPANGCKSLENKLGLDPQSVRRYCHAHGCVSDQLLTCFPVNGCKSLERRLDLDLKLEKVLFILYCAGFDWSCQLAHLQQHQYRLQLQLTMARLGYWHGDCTLHLILVLQEHHTCEIEFKRSCADPRSQQCLSTMCSPSQSHRSLAYRAFLYSQAKPLPPVPN